jgi:lysozyme
MPRKINAAGLDLIKSFESLRLVAYPDPATRSAPWTIGWGHTGVGVRPGLKITLEEAERFLREDLEFFERKVEQMVRVDINDNQFSALVSFAFNCGAMKLRQSTLLKKVNWRMFQAAADEFLKWNMADGKVMEGLKRRREAERALFLSP